MKIQYASHALFAIAIMVLSAHAQAETHVPLAYGQAADASAPKLAGSDMQSARIQLKSVQTLPGVSARTFAGLAPDINSGDRPSYRPNAMTGGEQNASVGVGSAAFTPLPETHVFNPSDIVTWQNPRPRLEVGLVVISTQNPISLNRISYRITSSDVSSERPNGSIFFTGNLDGTYATTRWGIPYGNDRIKSTADDPQRLMSGSASQSFTGEIVYIGFAIFYNTPTQADAEVVRRYIIEKNLTIRFEYFLDNVLIAQRTIQFAPSTIPPTPSITSFAADRTVLTRGENTTLRWSSVNASAGTISGIGAVPATGITVITPTATTSYSLTVTGASGTATAPIITITVNPPIQPTANVSLLVQLAVGDRVLPRGSGDAHAVLSGSDLKLAGEIRNIGQTHMAFAGFWQYRIVRKITVNGIPQWQPIIDIIRTDADGWIDWVGDGIAPTSVPLLPNAAHNTGYAWHPIAWNDSVYQFRLRIRTSDARDFVSENTAAVTISAGAGGTSVPQAVVKLIPVLSGAPGVYDFQRSTNLVTWSTLQRIDTRNGVPLVVLPENAFAGPVGFFRVMLAQ